MKNNDGRGYAPKRSEAIHQPRGRKERHPQERQHSAAEGERNRVPPGEGFITLLSATDRYRRPRPRIPPAGSKGPGERSE